MCWNDVAFCPNDCIKCLTERTVVDILIRENRVFPLGLTEVLLERYRKMRDHFLDSCVTHPDFWKQGDLRLADVKRYRDALLVIPATHSAIKGNDEWKDILKNPCVGHDLPVWMHGPKPCKNRRIMIVSQDPLRTGHGAGELLLSTPFGFHSADYRDNDGDLLMQLALRLMGGGFVLYFTDAMKIYNRKPEPLKLNKKTKKEESPCKGCAHYDECMTRCNEVGISKRRIQRDFKTRYNTCLADEIRIFNPDVILTFGKPAAMTLLPTAFGCANRAHDIGLNRSTFTNMVAPVPWRDNYSEIPTLSFLHPSRTNGNALKTIGGADKFIEHCVGVVNNFFNKKGKNKMNNTEKANAIEAETLRLIKRESDEYFHKFFASHKDSIKTVSEVEKLTGDFLDKRLKDVSAKESVSFADDVTIKVAVGGAVYPVLHVVVAEWKSGGLFKKATKGLFFIWNSDVKSSDVAMPLSDFYGFLDTNGLSNLSASVNYAGAAVSNIKVADVQQKLANEEPLFFSNSDEWQACDVNYSLKSISYDKENKALVLKVEDRLFT